MLACAALRLLHNTATTAFFIWIITGGLDAYAGTYDSLARRVGIEVGTADALVLTAAGLLVWAAFASVIQVIVYRRGLRQWDDPAAESGRPTEAGDDGSLPRPRPGSDHRGASTRVLSAWPPRSPSRCC